MFQDTKLSNIQTLASPPPPTHTHIFHIWTFVSINKNLADLLLTWGMTSVGIKKMRVGKGETQTHFDTLAMKMKKGGYLPSMKLNPRQKWVWEGQNASIIYCDLITPKKINLSQGY